MNKRIGARIITTLAVLFFANLSWGKEPPRIVTSIAPVHLLVSEVTKGITKPHLLVKGNTSPHHYALTPHDAKALSQADMVFYIGNDLENFLVKPLQNISKSAKKIPLSREKGITLLTTRDHALWENHDHDEEEHHDHGQYDMHIWLDPNNAKVMLQAIAAHLSVYDPEHKAVYEKNAKDAIYRLKQFDKIIRKTLKPYKNTPFIVFHDAYQYFEKHYGLHSIGALMLSSEVPLGAGTLDKITKAVRNHNVKCLFSEPQYDLQRIQIIADRTGSTVGVLDPLETGAILTKDGYGALLNNLAENMASCFQKNAQPHENSNVQ